MLLIKQSTAVILKMGPFVDEDDGKTVEPGLTIAQADIQISKNGGAYAQTSAGSPTTTYDADGWYPVPLTTTDTGTLGNLKVQVHSTGALPVWQECMVLPATSYGSIVNTGDSFRMEVDVQMWKATPVNEDTAGYPKVTIKDGTGTGELDTASGRVLSDLVYIHGTGLTETAGQLAGAFIKFFDVAAPTATALSIPDAVAGVTGGLATEAKLLAYIQLLARKDDAIETDNATELTAINADGGSGGGTFLNETDALEALRDRGDQAWLTGSSSGATKSYTTTDWTRTVGDDDGGVGSDTLTVNATYFSTGEVNSTTLLEVTVVFTLDDPTETALSLDVWGFYNGGGAHFITASALDTVGALYEPLEGAITVGSTVTKTTFELSPSHTNSSTGVVTVKFLHGGSATGITSHVFSVDKAQVNSSVPSTTAAKLLSYVQLLARSDAAIETDRSTELGEINTNEGSGAGDFSSQTDSVEALRDRGDAEWSSGSVTLADGPHGGSSAVLTLQNAVISGAATGLAISGTTAGVAIDGGTTGIGLELQGGSSSGTALDIDSIGGNAVTINTVTGRGIVVAGSTDAVQLTGGTGAGLWANKVTLSGSDVGGVFEIDNTNGPAIDFRGTTYGAYIEGTAGPGMTLIGSSGTDDLVADITGNLSGSVGTLTGTVTLADGSLVLAKWDQTTVWPLVAVDSGATQVARKGADSDTLETLSDQIDALTSPQILQTTTIATLASQTSFTLTAGSADDDAYNNALVVVTDASTSTQKALGYISDYTGATKTVTLGQDPGIFTFVAGDSISIFAWHPYIDAAISSVVSNAGAGAISWQVLVEDSSSNPLDGAEVWFTTDSAGTNIVGGTLTTNASGNATFMIDAGTYYFWKQLGGYNFTNPETVVVS